MYGGQLVEGEVYRNLCRTVTINILGFNYIDNDRYHNTFHLREDSTGIVLTGDIESHMIELQKLREVAEGIGDETIHHLTGVALEAVQRLRKEFPH